MEYQHERAADIVDEIKPLVKLHYDEIATHKDLKVLDPDYDQYIHLDEIGMLRCFTVRDGGILVGYFLTIITPHIHYRTCRYALNDILFVHPDYRGTTIPYRMIKGAMQDLRDEVGADILCIHMKIEYPFRSLLAKLGFLQTEENWEVEL
jgi:GNAT superfamily N-acetyltransferase